MNDDILILTKSVLFVDTTGDNHYIFVTESVLDTFKEDRDEDDMENVTVCGNLSATMSKTMNRLTVSCYYNDRKETIIIPDVSTARFIDYDI